MWLKGVKWLRKAAEQGLALAQNNLGFCYEKGEGVTKDEATAVQWYRKAAQQGYALAQFNLGDCLEKGKGVPADEVEADKWFILAEAQGDTDAKSSRPRLETQMKPEQIAEAQRRAKEFKTVTVKPEATRPSP